MFIAESQCFRRRRVAGVQLVGEANPTDASIVDDSISGRTNKAVRNTEDFGDNQLLGQMAAADRSLVLGL